MACKNCEALRALVRKYHTENNLLHEKIKEDKENATKMLKLIEELKNLHHEWIVPADMVKSEDGKNEYNQAAV